MSPANTKSVQPWTADRHIDINQDLHLFFDWLFVGKFVLDVGAGLGRSKRRIRHNQVTTYDPSPAAAVDVHEFPSGTFDVVTAFEVIEHVKDDQAFCQELDSVAKDAIFLTTPNWDVAKCQSVDHYREYTHEEWEELICGIWSWPHYRYWWGAYYKDGEGGWCELLSPRAFRRHTGLKHLVLIDKAISLSERQWLGAIERRSTDR